MRADLCRRYIRTAALVYAILTAQAVLAYAGPVHAEQLEVSAVEEIYVLRSLRETRVTPTDFCSPLDAPTSEDYYSFHTAGVSIETGRISNAKAQAVGHIRGCFGKTADAGVFKFYGEFETNGVKGKALGSCWSGRPDFPEEGLRLFSCYFALSDLPAPYVGGQLTTNSVNSKNITGEVSEPLGYTQVSVATVRLWKKRPKE